jgi:hypothetical protein
MNYLKYFNKKKKKSKHRETKALVIFDDGYVELVKTIETICNDMDYKILKLDELESGKINKLNKISEATQSQRLSSLPEYINEKLKILDKIVNNESHKFSFMLNETMTNNFSSGSNYSSLQTQSQLMRSDSLNSNDSVKSTAPITHWFQQDTKERMLFNTIQDNIYQICAKKKTLILIVDSFSHYEDDKNYLNSIMEKISTSKCPIVILTKSCENFQSSNNINSGTSLFTLLNETTKNYKERFSFYHTTRCEDYKKKTYLLIAVVLLLHLIISENFEKGLGKNLDGSLTAQSIFQSVKEIWTTNLLNELEQGGVFDRLVTISYKISLDLQWDLESIFFSLNEVIRKNQKYNYKEKLKQLNQVYNPFNKIVRKYEEYKEEEPEIIINLCDSNSNTDSQFSSQEGKNNFFFFESLLNENGAVEKNTLKKIVRMTENFSFQDALDNKISNFSKKNYNSFYFSVYEINKKIFKDSSVSKKDPQVYKNNEQLINCENLKLDYLVKNSFSSNEKNNHTNYYEKSIKSLDKWLKDILNEDCLFYKTFLLNKIVNINKRNLFEWNFFIQVKFFYLENK